MSGGGKRSVAEWLKLPRPSSTLPESDDEGQRGENSARLIRRMRGYGMEEGALARDSRRAIRSPCPLYVRQRPNWCVATHRSKKSQRYSITSSASDRNYSGILSPSALAVRKAYSL